jgi:hypothetical protein
VPDQRLDGTRVTTLVRQKFAAINHVTADMLDGAGVDIIEDMMSDQFVARLSTDVYGEKLVPHEASRTVEFPTTWWQMFRREHAGAWWMRWHVKRWPLRLEQVVLTAVWDNYVLYPWADLRGFVPPTLGNPVRQIMPPVIRVEMPTSFYRPDSQWQ